MTRSLLLVLALVGGVAACDSAQPKCDDEKPCDTTLTDDRERVVDEGEACLVDVTSAPYGTAITLEAGDAATVRVAFGACAPCGEDLQSDCTVTVDGGQLRVEGDSSWAPIEGDCPADCRPWFAECTSGALDAGDYELVYGGAVAPFTVPATGDLVCADAS